MSQATPTKFPCFLSIIMANFSENLVTIAQFFPLSMALLDFRVLESPHRYGVIFTFWNFFSKGHYEVILDVKKKYTLLTLKGICMNFLPELKFFILTHQVTSKQPHKIA